MCTDDPRGGLLGALRSAMRRQLAESLSHSEEEKVAIQSLLAQAQVLFSIMPRMLNQQDHNLSLLEILPSFCLSSAHV